MTRFGAASAYAPFAGPTATDDREGYFPARALPEVLFADAGARKMMARVPPIGIHRSASKLESFMRGCNVAMSVGGGSRLPALIEALERANRAGCSAKMSRICCETAL
jgi:hypothetical protein